MFNDVATVGVFFAISLLIFLVGNAFAAGRDRARNIAEVGDRSRRRRPSAFRKALAGAVPQGASEVEKIERDLKRAGYYSPHALVDYMSTRNTMVIGVLILGGSLAVAADPATSLPKLILGAGLFTAVLGYSIPRLILSGQANRRIERIQRGLPDALDIIRMCLTGGLPLRDALERVAREIEFFHPDIAVELEVVRRQAEADTMQKALKQFAARVDTPDVNALATLVSQTERMGTHVSAAVTEYADSVRRTHRQRAEERASKTSIKLLFPVIFCLAPPIYILLMGPPAIKLRNFLIEGHKPGGVLEPLSQPLPLPGNRNRGANGF